MALPGIPALPPLQLATNAVSGATAGPFRGGDVASGFDSSGMVINFGGAVSTGGGLLPWVALGALAWFAWRRAK